MDTVQAIVNIIKKNKKYRKLVMRSKHNSFESQLAKYGIKVDFYTTRNLLRVNNKDCFSDEILQNNSDKYFFILSPEAKFNKNDNDRYKSYGFNEYVDYIWYCRESTKLKINKNTPYNDIYGNNIISLSYALLSVNGYCSKIKIGCNNLVSSYINLKGNEHTVIIGDNCIFKPSACILETNSKLIIGSNVKINDLKIYIDSYSSVYIGDFSSLYSGKLMSGRNQEIVIGNDCIFSWDITILGHDGHLIWTTDGKCVNNTVGQIRKSIILGDHIWVGGETSILPNTKIGSGSICGYKSLVKGNYPNNCIICGIPAKVIKKNITWSRNNFSLNEKDDFKKIKIDYIKNTIK